ncbi:hypothetical protein MNBD_GAMMA11-2537 [hydrothermal vent metagenome]|uniref:DUF1439 domain-containing protein n=1 Tax=hydrothermal vent metagenome TaxID=652676 RepID=A0A3B0WZR3_9ZZZZ
MIKRVSLVIFMMLLSQTAMAFSYTLEISEKELQEKVSKMMPLEKKKYFVTVILSEPVIDLTGGNNEIGIFSHVKIIAPGSIEGAGKVKITGSLRYDSKTGSFFFKHPEIVSLEVNDVPEKYMPNIKKIAQSAVSKILATRPVYKLKDDNLKQKLAKSVLKSIKVENKKLLVELAAF